jgi:hypothetical protein
MSDHIPPGLFAQKAVEPDPAARLEGRLRRVARSRGLTLVKSRSRSPDSPTYGTYMLLNAKDSSIAHSGSDTDAYGLSLDQVALYLEQ